MNTLNPFQYEFAYMAVDDIPQILYLPYRWNVCDVFVSSGEHEGRGCWKEHKSSIFTIQSCVMNAKRTKVCCLWRISLYTYIYNVLQVSKQVSEWVVDVDSDSCTIASILLTCFTFVRTFIGIKACKFYTQRKKTQNRKKQYSNKQFKCNYRLIDKFDSYLDKITWIHITIHIRLIINAFNWWK